MKILANILLVTFLGSAAACTSAEEDLCDLKCECEYCSDWEYDRCVADYDESLRRAEAYGCEDYYDMWIDCRVDTAYCAGRDWDDRCGFERDRYRACVNWR